MFSRFILYAQTYFSCVAYVVGSDPCIDESQRCDDLRLSVEVVLVSIISRLTKLTKYIPAREPPLLAFPTNDRRHAPISASIKSSTIESQRGNFLATAYVEILSVSCSWPLEQSSLQMGTSIRFMSLTSMVLVED